MLLPLPPRRSWMDERPYSYQCPPLVMANQWGWQITCPANVEVSWDGRSSGGLGPASRGRAVVCLLDQEPVQRRNPSPSGRLGCSIRRREAGISLRRDRATTGNPSAPPARRCDRNMVAALHIYAQLEDCHTGNRDFCEGRGVSPKSSPYRTLRSRSRPRSRSLMAGDPESVRSNRTLGEASRQPVRRRRSRRTTFTGRRTGLTNI